MVLRNFCLNVSPPIWQSYINTILNSLQSRKYWEVIMDDLLLFTPSEIAHMTKLEDLLKVLRKNGLKISPKKCQLFRMELQYMGNTIFIKDRRVCVKALHSRLEAIQKIEPPTMAKQCKSFAGMVNFVSIFCPELQKLLKPIYDLTRKGKQFVWGVEQQSAFEEIKQRLQKPPVLHMPDKVGRFQLYSDTSKYAMGSALYQNQNGKPKLIAYASKRLQEAVGNYSITELEMCGLAINIASFLHLLRKVDFDAAVDHLAIMHIMRSKVEPATTRIKRLLEVLSLYSFNLYYIKGKDMIISHFLLRHNVDENNLHEIIPIAFNLRAVLQDKYYNLEEEKERYMIQTRSQTKASGVQLPEVHRTRKGLDPHKILKKQPQPIVRLAIEKKPRLGQRRAGIKRKVKLAAPSQKKEVSIGPDSSRPKPIISSDEAVSAVDPILPIPLPKVPRSEGLLPYILLRNRPPLKPSDQLINKQDIGDTKMDIEENSPIQENIISEIYERPNESYFQEPVELKDLIDTRNIIQ